MTKPTVRAWLKKISPISQDSRDSGVCTDTGVEPNRIRPPFASTSAMPSVRMICA